MKQVQITAAGIRKALRKYTYSESITEYIWNGFDAGASHVCIFIESNPIRGISTLKITDNGSGIIDSKKFYPFFESEKEIDPNAPRISSTNHGKNGVGRLTFFTFAESAIWETVYEKDGKNYKYNIRVNSGTLDNYAAENPIETIDTTGTTVTFSGIHTIISDYFDTNIKEFLCKEFAWFLELKLSDKFFIKINDKNINYDHILIGENETVLHKIGDNLFEIKFIRWLQNLNGEYSRYYFINSQGNEAYTKTTTFNKKGDDFFHSVYIKSSFFDNADVRIYENSPVFKNTNEGKIYVNLMNFLDNLLSKKRKSFLKITSDHIIEVLEKCDAFPKFKKDTWDQSRKFELEGFIRELYQVEPKIFTHLNKEQKKIFVHFLNLIIDSGERDKLIDILAEIITIDPVELEHLAESLKASKLSNIIRTIKLIEDRYKAIEQIKSLVFQSDLKANERVHLQKFMENHYWILGEQYHLITAAEPKFEEALRRYIYHLRGEKPVVSIKHPDKNKEMDLFMVRQVLNNDFVNNIVVELKHPKVNLGSKELEQVKKYMGVILDQDEFNANNMSWEFYLIGNNFDTTGYIEREIKNSQHHGEKSLVYSVDNYKIYVKTWSEIFTEFELRHKFLNEKLKLERAKIIAIESSADAVITSIPDNTAIQPPQISM